MRIFAAGNFDLFHSGHVNFLRKCSYFGPVTVALNTDAFAARYKRPTVMNLMERFEIVSACKYVDFVLVNRTDEDARPTILKSQATHIAHGDDWMGESLMKQLGVTADWLEEHNIGMIYVPYTNGVSTSDLIRRISQRSSHEHARSL